MRLAPLLLVLAAVTFAACDTGPGGSLYDPDRTSEPDPVISAVVTDDAIVLAGIDAITLQGSNFIPGETIVYFEDGAGGVARGQILSESASEIRVQTPNFPGDDLTVRVSVLGAEFFSPAMPIALRSAIVEFGEIQTGESEEIRAMTSDASGDLIASLAQNASDTGIFRFDQASGARTSVATTVRTWADLAVPDDGLLYGVDSRRVVWQIPMDGNPAIFGRDDAQPQPVFSALTSGASGSLWAGAAGVSGAPSRIYRFASDGSFVASAPSVAGAAFSGIPRDMTVFDGDLYVASEADVTSRVVRFPIQSDGSLGDGTVVFDVPTRPATQLPVGAAHAATALAFAADGTLFVGTNALVDPVYEVAPGGDASVLYPGVIAGPAFDFAWTSGTALYYATSFVLPTATEDARAAQLYTLETRRQGAL